MHVQTHNRQIYNCGNQILYHPGTTVSFFWPKGIIIWSSGSSLLSSVQAQSAQCHHAKHGHVRRVAPHQSHDEGRRNDVASTQSAATGVGETTPTLPAPNSTTGKPISKIWLTTPALPAKNSTTDKTISSIWFPAAHKGGPTHGSPIERTPQTTSPIPRATSALAYRCRQPTPCPCG